MEEQLISYKTALLAKEKGFDLKSNYFREQEEGNPDRDDDFCNWNELDGYCTIVTQSLLQKWFREVHLIEVFTRPFINAENHEKHYRCFIVWFDGQMYQDGQYFTSSSWEEALEIGLQEALKIIKT